MITIENHIGKITISEKYLKSLIWNTVTGCFGVADMNSMSPVDDIFSFIRRGHTSQNGVNVKEKDNKLIINIHISVTYGTNIQAVVSSLEEKVRYAVSNSTGIEIMKINTSVDYIMD